MGDARHWQGLLSALGQSDWFPVVSSAMTDKHPFDDLALYELAHTLGEGLADRGWMVSVAESCTGGWVGKCLTDVPGSSVWFQFAWISYADAAKQQMLGVGADALRQAGAVSETVVRAMAEGARSRSRSHLALAVSGVAGPGGGSEAKPVGQVCMAVAGPHEQCEVWTHQFDGDREAVRRSSVAWGLKHLLATLD